MASAAEGISNANGWTNPYRYDGRDGARYDASTGLYWLSVRAYDLSVRAYDPTLGRFLSRDPLNRAPLFLTDNPYVYAATTRSAMSIRAGSDIQMALTAAWNPGMRTRL
ncbi:MAG TPA: RHS repeat-associated core domain-containing protein [Ktedonobacterales bacterium]